MRESIIILTFIFCLFFNPKNISAQELFETYDTIPLEKFKISQTEFINRYTLSSYDEITGEVIYDDTIKSLINIYFQKRDNGIGWITNGLYIYPFSTTYGFILFVTHSRKNLYRMIIDYRNGHGLPAQYRKKIIRELEKESQLYQ